MTPSNINEAPTVESRRNQGVARLRGPLSQPFGPQPAAPFSQSGIANAVVDLGQARHDRIKAVATAARDRAYSDKSPLAVIDRKVRKLAQSARNAKRTGVPELHRTRRDQIMVLNEVRREILGRAS